MESMEELAMDVDYQLKVPLSTDSPENPIPIRDHVWQKSESVL